LHIIIQELREGFRFQVGRDISEIKSMIGFRFCFNEQDNIGVYCGGFKNLITPEVNENLEFSILFQELS